MSKYTVGVWTASLSIAVITGYNVNAVTGIASLFLVLGIAAIITDIIETILKVVITNFGK